MLWYDGGRDVKSCQTLSSRLAACPLHPLPHFPKEREKCIGLLPKGAREREQIPVRRNHFWQATSVGRQLGATCGGHSLVSTAWPCVRRRPGNLGFALLCHKGLTQAGCWAGIEMSEPGNTRCGKPLPLCPGCRPLCLNGQLFVLEAVLRSDATVAGWGCSDVDGGATCGYKIWWPIGS